MIQKTHKIKTYFAPLPARELIGDKTLVQKKYKMSKWSVFLSATFGYAFFYVCRLSLSVIKKPLVDADIFDPAQLGQIGSALFFSYAIGKLVNGFLSDHLNVNKFISIGLLFTALANLILGFFPVFLVFIIVWGLSGWFQSQGAAPCVVALTRWFKANERGTYYAAWSASHNIGKAIAFTLLPLLIGFGGWRWGFWGAGVVGIIGAIMVKLFLYDSPESKGLPSVVSLEQKQKGGKRSENKPQDVSSSQKSILKNPAIWLLALSSALMYVIRYAIESWGVFYAEAEKGYSNVEAAQIIGLTAISGIIGTVLSGFISDRFFKGSRNVPALVAGILNVLSVSVFLFYSNSNVFTDSISMIVHGFAIGILITFLGGLMAVDLAPKKAAGAAMGLIGIASYAGAGIQEIISGIYIEDSALMTDGVISYDFSQIRIFWLGAAILSVILALLVWNAKAKDEV
ncbi:MFS transporter [Aestuariivivens sediminis]|uniref:MFS transporter n=1 Tax=Aestuariivivens sediminis TaxID=2913557 RepID=UPI001F56BE99|nr:MFS transporter [Aestuariivivens sediminis]